jgi:hypothetical protein
MSFLTPGFLIAGGLLMAIPIAIHLLNRRRYKVVEWAAMRYLLEAMKKNRRRLRFESLLLLLARCAVFLLLGLALARPLGCNDSALASLAGRQIGLHVLVIDDSYSMAYEAGRADTRTHLDQAKKVAKQVISRLEAGSQEVAIISASSPARVLVRRTVDLDAASNAVDAIEQSFSSTDLSGAFRLAGEVANDAKTLPSKTLYLLTDCTMSAMQTDAQLATISQNTASQFRVVVQNLGLANQWNQAVADVRASDQLVRMGFGSDLQADVVGFGGSQTSVNWKLGDKTLPGSSRIQPGPKPEPITQTQAAFDTPGPVVAEVSIEGTDRLRIDDVRRQVIDVVGDMQVLIVEGKRGLGALESSGSFLRLALAPPTDAGATSNAARYVTPTLISDLELPGKPLGDYRSVLLAGAGAMTRDTARQLRGYVEGGGSVVIFMGEGVNGENYNSTLGAEGLLPGALVARVDSTGGDKGFTFAFDPSNPHPILGAFRNVEKSGLEAVQVFTYWRAQVDPARNVQRVLNFVKTSADAEAEPAITVQSIGRGRVVFVATSPDAEWSTLVAKPAYVTLIHELLGGAVGGGEQWLNRTVGDVIELPTSLNLPAAPVLRESTQKSTPLTRVDRGDGTMVWRSAPMNKPGVFGVEAGSLKWPVAVNVPSIEADVRTLNVEGIRHALGDIDLTLLGDSLPVDEASSASSDFSWPILLVLLPLLLAESLMAWRFGRARGAA